MILGIDPGMSGAWAVLDQFGRMVDAGPMPIAGSGAQKAVSASVLAYTLRKLTIIKAVIERVGAMPGQGVSGMFRFGRAVGTVEGVLGALMIPVVYVTPGTWKRHYGLDADKERARQKAIETWPSEASQRFSRKKDDGLAEAALIALWGLRAAHLCGEAA